MGWIKQRYKSAFWIYVVLSLLFGFAPWMTGTYFVNVAGTFLGAYFVLTVSIVAQIIWRSIFPKEET